MLYFQKVEMSTIVPHIYEHVLECLCILVYIRITSNMKSSKNGNIDVRDGRWNGSRKSIRIYKTHCKYLKENIAKQMTEKINQINRHQQRCCL